LTVRLRQQRNTVLENHFGVEDLQGKCGLAMPGHDVGRFGFVWAVLPGWVVLYFHLDYNRKRLCLQVGTFVKRFTPRL
jgi:hypothetical protein